MKNITFLLLSLLSIIILSGCGDDDDLSQKNVKLSRIFNPDSDAEDRFYYTGDQLTEMQEDVYLLNSLTQERTLNTTIYDLEYENDKVARVNSENKQFYFDYSGNDLKVTSIVQQDTDYVMTYVNYLDVDNFSVVAYRPEQTPATAEIKPYLDENNNLIRAVDLNDESVDIAFQHHYMAAIYQGAHTYDNKNNPYSNFAPEVQLWLTFKLNDNNLLERTFENGRPLRTYEYVYNADNFPTEIKTHIVFSPTETLTRVDRYFYE